MAESLGAFWFRRGAAAARRLGLVIGGLEAGAAREAACL
jgi:hypothetical protein